MAIDPVTGDNIRGVTGTFSAIGACKSNRQAEKAVEQQYKYDLESYAMGTERIKADHQYLIDKIFGEERNFDRQRATRSASNYTSTLINESNKYQDALDARDYNVSEQLYAGSLALNEDKSKNADEAAHGKLQEAYMSAAFDNEDAIIESLQQSGSALARGITGRSGAKAQQSILAEFGRDQSVLAASLMSAESALQSELRDIDQQYRAANFAAESNRKLPPVARLDPTVPLKTLDMEFLLPRELQEFDSLLEPIMLQIHKVHSLPLQTQHRVTVWELIALKFNK